MAVLIDVPYLCRLSQNSVFNWMRSLRPLRVQLLKPTQKGCSRCRHTQPSIDPKLIEELSRDPTLKADLLRLKSWLKADKLIVHVGLLRTAL